MARLLVGEAMRRPEVADVFGNAVLKRVLGFLKSYMARQVELGRLRPHDVQGQRQGVYRDARSAGGGKMFFPAIREDGLTDEEHVEAAVAIFLRGLGEGGQRVNGSPDRPRGKEKSRVQS